MDVVNQVHEKIPVSVHLMAGWPLILVLFGGVVGAVFGVLAYLINRKIYTSPLSRLQKILANLLCGMSALSAWWFAAQWIQSAL
jgi:hypothetical protein